MSIKNTHYKVITKNVIGQFYSILHKYKTELQLGVSAVFGTTMKAVACFVLGLAALAAARPDVGGDQTLGKTLKKN